MTDKSKPAILVVEDENVVAMDLVASLETLGYPVVGCTAYGEDAVALAAKLKPGLVLMDINLRGEMDGIDAARAIEQQLSTPVIYLTAYSDDATLNRARVTYPFGYLLKPFEDREVDVTIQMAVFHHKMESELRQSEQRLHAILGSIRDAVVATDADRRITFMNRSAEQLFNQGCAEAMQRDVDEVVRLLDPSSTERQESTITDGTGQATGYVVVIRDISERLQVQKEYENRLAAQAAVELRDEFLSIASHELKTPITPLKLQIQTLEKRLRALLADDQSYNALKKNIDMVRRQSDRLIRLVDSLLDITRIVRGRIPLDLESIDLSEVVRSVIADFHARSELSAQQLRVDLCNEITGQWDRLRLEQIISNLVENALKYGADRPVDVSARIDAGEAVLEVKDHGIGIAAKDTSRIFDRFERAVPPRSYAGFGLGLFITRQSVEALGGSISLGSELGEGSTFTVRLPLSGPQLQQPA